MEHLISTASFQQKRQTIFVSLDGIITDTDQYIFDWKTKTSIYEAHPFFEILRGYVDDGNTSTTLNFPCVHLEKETLDKICDITLLINLEIGKIEIHIFDYTEKYRELNAIAQQRNESILASKKLQLENEYLVKKEEFKNSFIANINHEIRTPLTSILGFIEVLEKTKLTFEQEELSRIIKTESLHLNTLINDMLDISKIESGQLKINQEPFLFHELMNGFSKSYAVQAKKKGVVFETHIDPNIQEYLIGDATRVYQIINNLLNNAFKFTEEGKISLTVTKNYQRTNKVSIHFKIEDTGLGILEDDLLHIFDRFTRFHKHQPIIGTGLGLAIVKNLVTLLDGDITVTSEVDKGTVFNLKLPFTFPITKHENEDVTRKKRTYTLPKTKKKFRILLVEDKETTQYLIMKILITHGRFFIDVVSNGEDAIKSIERRNYDLILMDLQLPTINGYKVTHMIRKNYGDAIISEIPIIGFTANATVIEREKCLKSGMDDFIGKPFEQEEFLYKIIKQIAKKNIP